MAKKKSKDAVVDVNLENSTPASEVPSQEAETFTPAAASPLAWRPKLVERKVQRASRGAESEELDLTVTIDRIEKMLAAIAFFDPARIYDDADELVPLYELDWATRVAIAGLKVNELNQGSGVSRVKIGVSKEYKLDDRLKALEMLGRLKHIKAFEGDDPNKRQDQLSEITNLFRSQHAEIKKKDAEKEDTKKK